LQFLGLYSKNISLPDVDGGTKQVATIPAMYRTVRDFTSELQDYGVFTMNATHKATCGTLVRALREIMIR
jgi:hypothetical protein